MSKVIVIHLKRDSMEVFSVVRGEKVTTAETAWVPEDLADKLRMIRDKFKTKVVRVLLDDELAYTLIHELGENEEGIDRQAFEKEAEQEFPDAVGSMWDYKIEESDGKKVVLIFAPVKSVMDMLSTAAIAAGMKIEDVEPVSFAVRREEDGVVSIAKKSLKGKDEDVLSLKVEVVDDQRAGVSADQSVSESVDQKKKTLTLSKSTKKLIMILGGVILVGGVVVGGVLRARSVTSVKPEVVISPAVSMAPSPTPEPVDLASLEVGIMNGSGVAGEASVVGEILVAEVFEGSLMTKTNADNYDYTKTEVQIKEGQSRIAYKTLERALNSDYEVVEGENLTSDSEYDVLIIVGIKIEEE